jgi:hypothetical protein
MALDTARRRKSAIYLTLPFRSVLPSPDGNVETEDRYNIAGQYSGLVASAPEFDGPIPAILIVENNGSQNYDLGAYFSGATSYSIDPAVEASWAFDAGTGLLTIDTDTSSAGNYGPYTVTGTNSAGSINSNAFAVTIATAPKAIAGSSISVLVATARIRSNWRM